MSAELDAEGMTRAREVAQWFIGDPFWGEMIVNAYLAPTADSDEAHEGINDDE